VKVLLGFHHALEAVNFGVEELVENQTYAKKVAYKEVEEKVIQGVVFIHECVNPSTVIPDAYVC
jgi:hypothetical protein